MGVNTDESTSTPPADADDSAQRDVAGRFSASEPSPGTSLSPQSVADLLEAFRDYLSLIADRSLEPKYRRKGGASDIVQETLMAANRDFVAFRGRSGGELRNWLKAILRHRLADFKRQTAAATRLETAGMDCEPDSEFLAVLPGRNQTASSIFSAAEDRKRVKAALARLPEDYQTIIRLRYFETQKFSEIAAHMNRTEQAVQKLWVRALRSLQKLVRQEQ